MRIVNAMSAPDFTQRRRSMFQETNPMKSSSITLPQYSLIDLGTLEGGTVSEATAINNLNQVVGWSNLGSVQQDNRRVDKSSFRHGFVWADGKLCDLNPGDGVDIRLPRGINDAGTVVGNLFPLGAASRSFCVRADGTVAETLPGVHRAEAINGWGCIAGACADATDTMQTVLICPDSQRKSPPVFRSLQLERGMVGGSMRSLNDRNEGVGFAMLGRTPEQEIKQAVYWGADGLGVRLFPEADAATASVATGINTWGQVVGYRDTPRQGQRETRTAFLRTVHGMIVNLPALPNARQTEACGLNETAQVVGVSGNRAFVWTAADGIADLNDCIPAESGWTLTRANAINANGVIVGQGLFHGQRRAFLALPATTPDGPQAWQ
ncbi:MAG: extracellular repeat protein family [Chthonomonadales bacterium]|nr:extracellular repeat protein family [Chthonomonadales bacterium]